MEEEKNLKTNIEVPTNPITSESNPPESTAYMNFNGFKFKITHNTFTVEKDKKKKNRLVGYKRYTQPLSSEKKEVLRAGGWNDEDIKRMMTAKPKMKVYSDGGYAYI